MIGHQRQCLNVTKVGEEKDEKLHLALHLSGAIEFVRVREKRLYSHTNEMIHQALFRE